MKSCGGVVRRVNDITILQEMLSDAVRVPLQQEGQDRPSVALMDDQAETTVEVKELPHESIVIRADAFNPRKPVFKGSKDERRRADFVIVSNEENEKWIICIETQTSESKDEDRVVAQLKGARCFISYCQCIGKSFWESSTFLDGYQERFISIANISIDKLRTRPDSQNDGKLHDTPDDFLDISGRQSLYFDELTPRETSRAIIEQ